MISDVGAALNFVINKGFQIHPDALKILEQIDVKELERIIKQIVKEKERQQLYLISQKDLESFLGIQEDETVEDSHEILYDPTPKLASAEGVQGFSALFTSRFTKLKRIMSNRPEAKMVKTISAVISTKSKDEVYVWGLVVDRRTDRNVTKITLDDQSGIIETIVVDEDLQKVASGLLMDQFVMEKIVTSKNGGFIVKDIILPDIPDHATNRSKTEAYAVFVSDLHVGSKYFMEKEFRELIDWFSSPDPIAKRVKFFILGGDVVDGIGIYPNQDKELVALNTQDQLKLLYEILDKVPKHIKVFIAPGNHDPGRRALPQPAIPAKYNPDLWGRKNFFMVGNPAIISLNGVKVLIFHGQSVDDIVKTTPGLSYDKPAKVMQYLLKARHLSPIYGAQTPLAPELEDYMVIDEVPDIFHAGHVHVIDLDLYKNILILNSGAWQSQTPFQSGVGITPTPGVAVLVNLKTFKVYTKDFSK
ncbi:MAG: DNA-directed DNA polymerase II small subunit [Nitrososphaeria archaeon]|nr:DNA-directed DNA polymerase II small subunit [Nitrososphaeria archaeon]NDB63846.1 DNA-directed DNA polymerase II small subunit [Nitrosopumilaceae archaeon]NDB88218.1 DNA-directed DNA polymerase II small subunit [Nitrososphaerota archaeon]NDB46547.1 DNA-directed DNA polymerase II small subunit [Nitrososphaeria archaeon]NDB90102.1 DNA-directed DNA polymerase II small subunit [Nitrososphaerota archaeon]